MTRQRGMAMITVLLVVKYREQARDAPRRVLRGLRRIRDRRRLARNTRLRWPRSRRGRRHDAISDFASARALLERRLAGMVGLSSIKEHLLALLDALDRRVAPARGEELEALLGGLGLARS